MKFFYTLSIYLLRFIYFIVSPFHYKAKLFVEGRKSWLVKMKERSPFFKNAVWFHFASLGEFEQGRPLIEAIKKTFPERKILITFFSPSGYESKKNYELADAVYYLPWDTPYNAAQFVSITQPVMAIFVKYEFWYFYTEALKKKSIPILSISCILRKEQVFFKNYGSFFRKILYHFDHFFAQDQHTADLLSSLNIASTLSGDTRFDRVVQIYESHTPIEVAEKFKNNKKLWVAGSCWKEDMNLLIPFINNYSTQLKFIIAPHEISVPFIEQIENSLSVSHIRYSQTTDILHLDSYSVLIIDNIGLLSHLYRYGEFAYVGGALGNGLHNILEAACYGMPIFFGSKNYQKYKEATDLIARSGAFAISDYSELKYQYEQFNQHPQKYLEASESTQKYVRENIGATEKIMNYCIPILSST